MAPCVRSVGAGEIMNVHVVMKETECDGTDIVGVGLTLDAAVRIARRYVAECEKEEEEYGGAGYCERVYAGAYSWENGYTYIKISCARAEGDV